MVLLAAQRREEAEAAFRRALALEPDDPETVFNLGLTLRQLGRVEPAMALLEAAVTAASRNGQVEVTSGDVGSDRTGIEVAISTKETAHTEGKIRETLRHLFKVIGNANGRVLLVDVTRTLEPDPEQPQSAAGRFAKVR